MKLCTNCGIKNPDESTYCVRCGSNLTVQPPPISCPSCGAPNMPKSTFCESCGKRMFPEPPGAPSVIVAEPETARSALRGRGNVFWACVLLIIGGLIEIGTGIATFFREIPTNEYGIDVSGYVTCCGVFVLATGLVAAVAGFVCLSRRYFYLAIVGAIVGMLGLGFYLTGALICFAALVLIALSKDEFKDW